MKRIVIVRHAKAVPYGYHDDFHRDLQERGKKDAKIVGSELHKQGIKADAMISSPAKRAMKTARIFAKKMNFNKNHIRQMNEIYEGLSTYEFLDIINKLPDQWNTVFFFGHNPGFHLFAKYLLSRFDEDMPTCATIGIDFDGNNWKEVKAHSGSQRFRIIPKMYRS
jgi:phosphohistidine phosphatase